MPTDNRIFTGSVSIRVDDTRTKLDLSPAEDHGGEEGLFRVRLKRRWIDTPEGKPLFFDRARLGDFIAAHAFGEAVSEAPAKAPDIPRGSRVTVKYWLRGDPHWEGTRTDTPPFRGYDGRFYIGLYTVDAGFMFAPVEDITIVELKRRRLP